MAIQHNIEEGASQFGIAFNGAYYRVASVSINRQRSDHSENKFEVGIDLSAYATSTPTDETREVDFKRYNTNLTDIEAQEGEDFLSKCYTWVMAQPDMDGSTAV